MYIAVHNWPYSMFSLLVTSSCALLLAGLIAMFTEKRLKIIKMFGCCFFIISSWFLVCCVCDFDVETTRKRKFTFFYYFHFKRIQQHIKASLLCRLLNGYYYMLCIHFITLFSFFFILWLIFCSYFTSVQQLNIFIVSLLQFTSLFIFLVLNAPVDLLISVIAIIFNSFFLSQKLFFFLVS